MKLTMMILAGAIAAACGAASKTVPAAPTAAAEGSAPSCPSVSFSCLVSDGPVTGICIEGGEDLAKALRPDCVPAQGGHSSDAPCARAGALGGCFNHKATDKSAGACNTMWIFPSGHSKTVADVKELCEHSDGTFIAP